MAKKTRYIKSRFLSQIEVAMSSSNSNLLAESLTPRSRDLCTGSKEGVATAGEESGFGSFSGYSGHIAGQTRRAFNGYECRKTLMRYAVARSRVRIKAQIPMPDFENRG